MKYKLIKTYPGSLEIDTIIDLEKIQCNKIQGFFKNHDYWNVNVNDIKNNPEYWEEVAEKDYEILSFISSVPFKNGHIVHHKQNNFDRRIETYLKDPEWRIYSVKRLSDYEVFTVGDFVKEIITGQCKGWEIKEFSLKDNRCFTAGVNINNVEKLREALFITEDGIEIFKRDEVTFVRKADLRITGTTLTTNIDKEERIWDGSDGYLQFSTKEAAEEYILMNKPCLSITDIINITYSPSETKISTIINKLKEKVKLKL